MRKKEMKNISSIKWIKRAKNMCVFIVVAFLAYVFVTAQILNEDYGYVMATYPIINIGFIISTANLIIWFFLKRIIDSLENNKDLEFCRLTMIVIVIAQCFLLNYISVILLIVGMRKLFNWRGYKILQQIKKLKQESKLLEFLGITLTLCLFVGLTFLISLSILQQ